MWAEIAQHIERVAEWEGERLSEWGSMKKSRKLVWNVTVFDRLTITDRLKTLIKNS